MEPLRLHHWEQEQQNNNYLKGSIGDAINLFMACCSIQFQGADQGLGPFFCPLYPFNLSGLYWKPKRTALVT
jgi:hypothetical protein